MMLTTMGWAQGQSPSHAAVVVPDSTVERPEDVGLRAHTNHLIKGAQFVGVPPQFVGTAPAGETPASISPVYNLAFPATAGAAGSNVIVIVDAFDYPTAAHDLDVFSQRLGLPVCAGSDVQPQTAPLCFTKTFAAHKKPRTNCGWAQEAALDIEWAHAMAPNAQIVLMEAASNSFANLFAAVDAGTTYIQQHGGGQLSMSWGGSEFSSEASNDVHFQHNGISYFASSGDTGGVTIYPGVSPSVISAGGTTINRDRNGNFVSETGWSGSGGGPSQFESIPSFQVGVANASTTQRSSPDFSFDADPNTGVSVFDSTPCQNFSGWLVFGGTSVSAPSLAGIVNRAGHFFDSATELSTIYGDRANTADFRDITSGTAGNFSARAGYDFVTGVGSNQGLNGK